MIAATLLAILFVPLFFRMFEGDGKSAELIPETTEALAHNTHQESSND